MPILAYVRTKDGLEEEEDGDVEIRNSHTTRAQIKPRPISP